MDQVSVSLSRLNSEAGIVNGPIYALQGWAAKGFKVPGPTIPNLTKDDNRFLNIATIQTDKCRYQVDSEARPYSL